MTVQEIFNHALCSFVGTVSFAVIYNVPRKYYFACGVTGMAGWMTYLLVNSQSFIRRFLFRSVRSGADIKDTYDIYEMSNYRFPGVGNSPSGAGGRGVLYGLLHCYESADPGFPERHGVV